jgi:hypothetical protein
MEVHGLGTKVSCDYHQECQLLGFIVEIYGLGTRRIVTVIKNMNS